MKTISEVAAEFHVHYQTVRNWINGGLVKAIKIGNTIRIPDEEIEKLKAGQCNGGAVRDSEG